MKHSPLCEGPRVSWTEAAPGERIEAPLDAPTAGPSFLDDTFLLDDTSLFNLDSTFSLDPPTQEELESLVDGLDFLAGDGNDIDLGFPNSSNAENIPEQVDMNVPLAMPQLPHGSSALSSLDVPDNIWALLDESILNDPPTSSSKHRNSRRKLKAAATQATKRRGGARGEELGLAQGHKTFRGVSRHRLTQRWEASLWLNGKQLYLGGFDVQEEAARAYDLAALACKGDKATINFDASDYQSQLVEMVNFSEEEVVAHIRRRSTAFSRGRSRFRGVSGQSGRWEARIGSFRGRKNVSFGVFETEEDAARQYDRALVIEKGRSAKTNFPLVEYELEGLKYWRVKAKCTTSADIDKIERSYTLPLGREITIDEVKRGIVITGEALISSLGLTEVGGLGSPASTVFEKNRTSTRSLI